MSIVSIGLAGCETPPKVVTYPPGTLPVRVESSTHHSTCLIASVAMAANYLLGERRFSEASIRAEFARSQQDETHIADVQAWLDQKGLHLITLVGEIDGKPPTALRYWIVQRGYPVICIINRHGDDPAFNHAVVVSGIQAKPDEAKADMITYLDPSVGRTIYTVPADEFDALWQRGGRAMMIVVAPPPESQPDSSIKEKP